MKRGAAKKKGRGFDSTGQKSAIREFESLPGDDSVAGAPQRSVEVNIYLQIYIRIYPRVG